MASNPNEVAANVAAVTETTVPVVTPATVKTTKAGCFPSFSLFSCASAKANCVKATDLDGDGDFDAKDAKLALNYLIINAGKSAAEAQRLIDLSNKYVANCPGSDTCDTKNLK